MKRLLATTCAVALLAVAVEAHADKISAGFEAGGMFGDFGGDDAPENLTTRNAFMGGGFVACAINPRLGVRGEILYVQKGAEGDFLTDDGDIHTALYKLDYVDIPVLFTANFPASSNKFGLEVFAGPSFNFNVSAKAAVEEHGTLDLDNVKSFEFGAVVGAGVSYALQKFSLIGNARYAMGISSVSEDVAGSSVAIQNQGLGAMGGLSFPIGPQE
jgi:hypothetical protein